MKVISRLLFLYVLNSSAFGFGDWWYDDESVFAGAGAEIIPDEINFFIGEAVQVFGIQHDPNISDIYFAIDDGGREIKLNTTRRNDTHVVTILKGSEKTKGRQTLRMIGTKRGSKSPEDLDSSSVFILDRLQNVTNVSSIWYYSRKRFEVRWQSPANYSPKVSVETGWIANSRAKDKLYNCSLSNNTFCRVEGSVGSILSFHMVTKVDDHWWKIYRQNQEYFLQPQIQEFPHFVYRVKPKEKAMPEKPSSLIINGKSSRCFNISWNNPGYFIFQKESALYYIEFKDENTDKVKKTHSSELPFSEFGKVLQFCGLDPNTFYSVNLQVKPKKDGYWSKPTEDFASTSEDRPSNGPPMTKTSFWLGNCNGGKRDLILYWNDLKPKEANGKLTQFLVELNSTIGYVRRSMNCMDAQLGCNESCQVNVYSATDIGRTEHPSRLKIPSNVFNPPFPVDFKVEKLTENRETGQMDVNMTWAYENLAALHNVSLIVYFCQGQTFSNKHCLDDFSHKIVPFQKQFFELRNITLRTDRFGYALEKNQNELSGITWSDCIYSRDKEPSEVTGVKAYPHNAVGSILVVWNAQRCSQDTKALVLRYRVQYCTMSKQCKVKISEGGYSSSLVLKNLDVRETYTIQVSAVTLNSTGPSSQPVKSTPQNSSKVDSEAVNIGPIAAITAIIIVSFLVFCCCWKVRQRKKKMRETLPYLPFGQKKKGADPNQSDSGINTQTDLNSTQTSTDDSVDPYENIPNEGAVHEPIPPEPLANSPGVENSTPSQDMPPSLQDSFPEPRRSEMAQALDVELETILSTSQVIEENAAQQEDAENRTVGAECLINISNKESCIDHQKPNVSTNVQDVDDYDPPINQPPFGHVTDVNAERCDDLFYEIELVTTSNDSFTNSPNIQIPDQGNMCENLNQSNTDLLPCIKNGHDMESKGNDQSCSSDGYLGKAMTGNNRSGESSSSSLTPNSYVHITTVEKSNTSQSPVEASDSVDNYVVDFRNSPQTKLFIPTSDGGGREQTATVYARFSLDGSSPIDKCHSSTAGIEYLTQMEDIPDSSQNIKNSDRLKDSHVKRISMKVEKDNPTMQSLSNGNRAYIAPNDLIQNMLYERKISEDEGISSPGIFMGSSNATEPNYMDLVDVSHLQNDSTDEISDEEYTKMAEGISPPGIFMGSSNATEPNYKDLVDVSHLQSDSTDEISDEEYAENGADEFSGNGNNDYTD